MKDLVHVICGVNKNKLEGEIHIYSWNVLLGKKQMLFFKKLHWKTLGKTSCTHNSFYHHHEIIEKRKLYLEQPDFLFVPCGSSVPRMNQYFSA